MVPERDTVQSNIGEGQLVLYTEKKAQLDFHYFSYDGQSFKLLRVHAFYNARGHWQAHSSIIQRADAKDDPFWAPGAALRKQLLRIALDGLEAWWQLNDVKSSRRVLLQREREMEKLVADEERNLAKHRAELAALKVEIASLPTDQPSSGPALQSLLAETLS